MPVLPGVAGLVAFKNVYFVDGTYGHDGNSGLGAGAELALKTIQRALNLVRDSDSIVVLPAATYDEELITGLCPGRPSLVPDGPTGQGRYVTLMGASNTRWAFDSPQIYNTSDGNAGVFVRSPGFRLSGFRLVGDPGSPICVKAGIDGAGADVGSVWAPGLQIDNCVFYGAVGSCSGLSMQSLMDFRILNNLFDHFAGTGLGAIVHAAGGFSTFPRGHIMGNIFTNCKDNIVAPYGSSIISHNIFGDNHVNALSRGLILTGGTSNTVTFNFLGGATYDGTQYLAAAGDNWAWYITEDDTSSGLAADTPWTTETPN